MNKKIIVAICAVILCSLVLGNLYLYYVNLRTTNKTSVYIIINKNSTLEQTAKQLVDKDIIKSQGTFINYAKLNGFKDVVIGGNFIIKPNTNYNTLISKLRAGKADFTVVTIPEGYTLYQIASKLEEDKLVKKDDILQERLNSLKNNNLMLTKNDTYYDLEGYLFPDTYYIPNGASKDDIISMMTNRFEEVFTDEDKAQAKKMGLDVNQVITIASLIEKEAANDSERSRIAGVIYNRLKKGMPLQIDAAVIYANTKGETSVNKVTYNMLKVDSKYNTYMNKGLPPGPIASPGKASIEAALYPENNDYLYYVANGNGHVFSKTYEEHLNNVKKYIK
jgi:conserved hypothetical protein, YceG family